MNTSQFENKKYTYTYIKNILLFNGNISNINDVKIGDKLMGHDSKPREILDIKKQNMEVYKIIPSRGEMYTVSKKHKLILTVYETSESFKKGDNIEMVVEEFLSLPKKIQKTMRIFKKEVEFEKNLIPIDSYLLGLWIGDPYHISQENILNSLSYIYSEVEHVLSKKFKSIKIVTSLETDSDKEKFADILCDYGLLTESGDNKYIPLDFIVNTKKCRLNLLAGLLDVAGSFDIKGSSYEFKSSNERLVDDCVFLIRSLGFFANKRIIKETGIVQNKRKILTTYKIIINGNITEIPCRILKKKFNKIENEKDNLSSNFHILFDKEEEYPEFVLDGDNKFLLSTLDVVSQS
jgi:replicative DNA helicase